MVLTGAIYGEYLPYFVERGRNLFHRAASHFQSFCTPLQTIGSLDLK